MGRGNYGTVYKAIDKRDRSRVAIKKINNAFANMIDAQRTLREISILNDLGAHPNVMKLYNVRLGSNHKDVYLFLEFSEVDLLTLIRSGFCND
jgi:mitogen-activated protein kinase 15